MGSKPVALLAGNLSQLLLALLAINHLSFVTSLFNDDDWKMILLSASLACKYQLSI